MDFGARLLFAPEHRYYSNLHRNVVKGFNVVDSDFIFAGTASKTELPLVDPQGIVRTAAQFLASDSMIPSGQLSQEITTE